MAKVKAKGKILFNLLILLIVFLAILFLILIPYGKKIIYLQKNIELNQQELEENYLKIKHLRKSIEAFGAISEAAEKYSAITIKEGEEINIITQLEELALKNNIRQKLDLKDSKGNKKSEIGLPFYTFSFRNQGNFENQINYFKDLELLPYYIVIRSINWQRGGGDNYSAEVIANFDAIIYVF